MNTIVTELASAFVDVALNHRWWAIQELPESDSAILLNTVLAAGFNAKRVVPEKIVRACYDQKGNALKETIPVNSFCMFAITNNSDNFNDSATGWLDTALSRVYFGLKQQKENREKLIAVMIEEIKRSNPLEIILLTPNSILLEKPPLILDTYFVDHTRDDHKLVSRAGLHRSLSDCHDGIMDYKKVATGDQNMLKCRNCHRTFLFPAEIKTYGDLRVALKTKTFLPASHYTLVLSSIK